MTDPPDSSIDDLRAENAALRDRLDVALADARVERERLTYELGHRVKNTLGVVQALASQTLRAAATPQEAMDTLNHRVLALARANDAILKEGWTKADLGTVAHRVLEMEGAVAGTLTIDGPNVPLAAGAALSFCMALHELATNARRHGAGSVPAGRVELSWRLEGERLLLGWTERDGPAVEEPAKRRFGLRLIEQSLRSAFGRDVTLAFEPEGFSMRAATPLTHLARHA